MKIDLEVKMKAVDRMTILDTDGSVHIKNAMLRKENWIVEENSDSNKNDREQTFSISNSCLN